MKHFLDTFAILEILKGNEAYQRVLDDPATGLFNLLELHVAVAREDGDERADEIFRAYRPFAVAPTDEEVLEASRFKRRHARKRFSYADALGYAIARGRGVPFVTGDRAFQEIEGVQFLG